MSNPISFDEYCEKHGIREHEYGRRSPRTCRRSAVASGTVAWRRLTRRDVGGVGVAWMLSAGGRNPVMPLHPDTMLDVQLSAICSRNRYTTDPGPVLDELRARAGVRGDILAYVAGTWAGYYDDEDTRLLADALLTVDGAVEWVQLGKYRRGLAPHKNP